MPPRDQGLIVGWGWCIWGPCSKATEASTSRLRVRDVLVEEQTPRSANSDAIAAVVALLSFFVGLAIFVLIVARLIKGRGDSERHSLAADQQWLSGTGKAAGMYEDDLSPDHRAGHEAGYFEGQGCSRC